MLLCVILFWPSKIENSLIIMQMCLKFENLRKIDWKSYFWEIWVQYKCFWKAFHLILMHSIHKILCFEEFLHKIALFFNIFFPEFWSIELVSWPIEIVIKNLFWICLAQLVLDQLNVIFDRSNLFFDQSKIVQRVFKNISFSCVCHYSNFFKKFFLSLFDRSRLKANFFHFPSNFFKGFWLLRLVRPFCPSFFIYFHVSCIFFMHFGKISNLRKIGVFVDFNQFFQNWSLGFCYRMLLNYSLVFNFDQFVDLRKLEFF